MYLLSRGSGYPVLFIHGIPTSSQLWNGIIDKLLGRFTCMAVDLPGLGRTPKGSCEDACDLQLDALADQIETARSFQNVQPGRT
jgi:pimeloyl-ACP methyl ester carboxylesterase